MREMTGDLWDFHQHGAHVAITTNGSLTLKHRAVLGRGVALEAAKRFPELPTRLGSALRQAYADRDANTVPLVYFEDWQLFAFPVKWDWREDADPDLIIRSADRLMAEIDRLKLPVVYTVRPGCGNGHLHWSEVKPLIESIFDNRVVIIQR